MAKKTKFRMTKFSVPSYIFRALDMLKPPEDITVSEWAEKYRLLDERSSAMSGYWRNSVTPYLVGIMDEFNAWETEKIVFVKPTQCGGTEALMNMLAFTVAQDPAPTMIVEPSKEMAESFSVNRLQPMFEKSPALKNKFYKKSSEKLELQFDGMYINLTGSESPASLASKPIKKLFLDEVDKYPGATKKEADPVSLAMERTKTFSDRKIYMCSTPTTTEGKIWRELQSCDEEKHFFVPCSHCGEMIELKFSQLHIPERKELSEIDRAALASYICQKCGGMITDADKVKILQKGEWRSIRKNGQNVRSVGFWLSTLYSPFTRFADIAKTWIKSKGDPDLEHNFQNSWLGLPYEEKGEEVEEDIIKSKQTELPEFTLPEWTKILVGGVDVQEASLYYVILAVGVGFTSQVITCGQALSFEEIERVMNTEYIFESGEKKLPDLALVDSGNDTDRVYNFCLQNREWALPCKGSSGTMLSHYKISNVNKVGSAACGMSLVMVDGGKYKDMIFSRIKRSALSGSFMVYKGISEDFCAQLCSEHKVFERVGGVMKGAWKPKKSHIDNHYLDATVYAMTAADLMGARQLFLQEQEQAQKQITASMNMTDTQLLDSAIEPSIKQNQGNEVSNNSDPWYNLEKEWLS